MKPHPGLKWCIFHILTGEDIDDFTDIKFDSLVYDQNIFESSSKSSAIFGYLRKSLVNFRTNRKILDNIRVTFRQVMENLKKYSETGWKSSENCQKRHYQYVYDITKITHDCL